MKHIAVIGGGAAGLAASWSLSQKHNVTLFEFESHLGGHAYSHPIEDAQGNATHIDMGVDYFNERLSPNLMALLAHLGIETFVAPLTMRFQFKEPNQYWSNTSFDGELFEKFHEEFNRFHRDMSAIARTTDERLKRMSIGDYLDEQSYSEEFRYQALVPLMTIYSGCKARSLDYNLTYAAISFELNLLSFFCPGYWRKAIGGIRSYVDKIQKSLGDSVQCNARINQIEPSEEGVRITFVDGLVSLFDKVVFATHSDITLSLLSKPTSLQSSILSRFEYTPVTSYFHSDQSILSSEKIREYAEFQIREAFDPKTEGQKNGDLTRISNNLFPYRNSQKPLLVTFDPTVSLEERQIHHQKNWKLPKLRPQDFALKQEMGQLQGLDHLYYCGTDTTLTGHEGAIVSGLVIAQELGSSYPFAHLPNAKTQFEFIQNFMGFNRVC